MNMNRLAGILLIVLGVIVGIVAGAWLFTNDGLTNSAQILGLGLVLVAVVAPLVGFGIYLSVFGGKQAKQQQSASEQRTLLNIVQSRGQVDINDVALEMQLPREQIRSMIYNLVGLEVFSGYINWDKGVLYSSDASQLRDLKQCPNCGGEITLSGKGVAKCRFCGTEFFLS
ncbi:MAG TPA: hypothetical protein PKD09_24205 [Aggregatilinea sp.]|uniref:hypothetical protein n=1 Tax=Aggregatilinea sp. TaxID=2806333 RepID=UPI002BD4925C|nr:hypothetical protein [Aggregatilinea sp.]HML24779.1 hypothetical protein [Aggregatilinea sp.]